MTDTENPIMAIAITTSTKLKANRVARR